MNSRTEKRLGIAAAAALTVAIFIIPAGAEMSPERAEIALDRAVIHYAYAETASLVRDISHNVRNN
ncbi:hypothetical protein DUT91_05605 [Phyllobacterium salinisoli]|uniref:Uncharacterized protein n=1 Tax=Phyllobacterium salinisoli TaxID=1899321 RepID=A0A368K8W9_9HYPH|nr:hypothetical protein [Phyllobacterium salinisoli]RCS24923.1 hypothetical protein DUT91_05605 [Phyllobacterium salinisoli]